MILRYLVDALRPKATLYIQISRNTIHGRNISTGRVASETSPTPPPRASSATRIRPIGITLLAILLVSQAIGGIGNGIILFTNLAYPFAHPRLLGSALFLHGLISAAAFAGVWKLRPWAPRIIAAWVTSLALAAILMVVCMPEAMVEHVPPVFLALYAVFTFGVGILIYAYVRRAIARNMER